MFLTTNLETWEFLNFLFICTTILKIVIKVNKNQYKRVISDASFWYLLPVILFMHVVAQNNSVQIKAKGTCSIIIRVHRSGWH